MFLGPITHAEQLTWQRRALGVLDGYLDVAVAGFNATTGLLRGVHLDLVGTGPHAPRDLTALERDPIGVLGRLLHDVPTLPQPAPTDLQATPARTQTGAHWRVVARAATLAHHDWATARPSTRPTGPTARAELVVHARIAEALAATGPDLARDLRAAGRTTDAARLLTATTSGLRITAAAARQAARTGAAPHPADLPRRTPPLVLIVRRPSHLPAALHRLTALVENAQHLTPQHIQLIARAAAETAHTAAGVLRAHGHPGPAAVLDRHADLLATTASTGRCAVSITPPDPRPLAQARQIHQTLIDLRGSNSLGLHDAWKAGHAIPAVTRALDAATTREITRRAWLAPSQSEDLKALTWVPVDANNPHLPIRHRTTSAARHADQVTTALALAPVPGRGTAPAQRHTATPSPSPSPSPTRSVAASPARHPTGHRR